VYPYLVFVNESAKFDLTKRFETDHINWTAIDRKLIKCGPLDARCTRGIPRTIEKSVNS
jgi:hypothetical protein